MVILECRGVTLRTHGADGAAPREVLRGVSFALEAGERLNVVGPSGGGKSTLLRLLNRFDDPDQGTVLFHGKDLRTYDPLEVRRRIALTLQTPVMFDGTVRDNLLRHPPERRATLTEADLRAALEDVALDGSFLDRPAGELSGGEKQRVAIARALLMRPEILLLDEPTSALDPQAAGHLIETVTTLNQQKGLTLVVVSHDLNVIRSLSGRLLFLAGGEVLVDAETCASLEHPTHPLVRDFVAGRVS
jgi:putative ABC transport system ATP-binding protein